MMEQKFFVGELYKSLERVCELLENKYGGRFKVETSKLVSTGDKFRLSVEFRWVPLNTEELALVIWTYIDQTINLSLSSCCSPECFGLVYVDKDRNISVEEKDGAKITRLLISGNSVDYEDRDGCLCWVTQVCGWTEMENNFLERAVKRYKRRKTPVRYEEVLEWLTKETRKELSG